MSKEYDSLSEYSIEENSSLTIPGGHQQLKWPTTRHFTHGAIGAEELSKSVKSTIIRSLK